MTANHPRRATWTEVGFFAASWFGLLFAGRSALFGDPGTYWHIEVGRILNDTRAFIHADSFSFTRFGETWIAMQWLGEWAMYRVWSSFGFDGLLVAATTLLAWTYAAIAGRMLRAGLHWLPTAVFLCLVLAASSHHFLVRPHLLSIALLAWTTSWLIRFDRGAAGWSMHPFWPFVVFVFWTNVHAGALGGVVTFALATVGWVVARAIGWPEGVRDRQRIAAAVVAMALAAASIFINPYGIALPKVWLSLSSAQDLQSLIKEHGRMSPIQPPGSFIVLLAAGYLAMLASVPIRQWRVTWALPLPWLAMAFDRIRHAPLFAVVVAVVVADMLASSRWLQRLASSGSDLFSPSNGDEPNSEPRSRLEFAASIALCCALGFLLVAQDPSRSTADGDGVIARLDPQVAPMGLLPALRTEMAGRPAAVRVFNDLNFGGFVTHFWPGRNAKSFIDDRCELFTTLLPSYCAARERREDSHYLDLWLHEYRPDFALVEKGGNFDRQLREREMWRLVAETEHAAVFARDR